MKPHLNLLKMCVGVVCYHLGMWEDHDGLMLHCRVNPAMLVSKSVMKDFFFASGSG